MEKLKYSPIYAWEPQCWKNIRARINPLYEPIKAYVLSSKSTSYYTFSYYSMMDLCIQPNYLLHYGFGLIIWSVWKKYINKKLWKVLVFVYYSLYW